MTRTSLLTRLSIVALALALLPTSAFAQAGSEWDITVPRGTPRQIEFTTDEGTWMSLDVSPDGQWIAFDLLGHIYRMPVSGGAAEPLTQSSGLALNIEPEYSPDGRHIAFVSDRAGQNNLWIMDADGSNPRAVFTDLNLRVIEPVWTPDGEYIVVKQMDFNAGGFFQWGLFMYHRDGGRGIELLPYSPNSPAWPSISPDGRFVYFHRFAGNILPYGGQDATIGDFQLQRLELATGEVSAVTSGQAAQQGRFSSGGAFAPEVSPDGRWLAFGRRIPDGLLEIRGHLVGPRTGLWLRDLETGSERLIMDPVDWDMSQEITRSTPILPRFSWTPDGSGIVLSQGGQFRRLTVATGEVETIPFSARVSRTISEMAYATSRIDDGPFDVRFVRWPTTSPDGSALAFQALGRIWIQDMAEGSQARRLTDADAPGFEYGPTWSPDGRWIAYTTYDEPEGGRVWRIRSDGSSAEEVTEAPGEYANPVWSLDGTELLIARGSGATSRGRSLVNNPWHDLVRLPLDGGEPAVVTQVTGANPPLGTYSEDGRIYFAEDGELVSVQADGSDRRAHVRLPTIHEATPSPDGRQVAFVSGGDVYVAPIPPGPGGDNLPVVDRKGSSLPVARVTTQGGLYPRWKSNTLLELGSSNRYFLYDTESEETAATTITMSAERVAPTGTIALTNGRVITLADDGVLENATLVVEGSRLLCVGTCDTNEADEVIDLGGATVMPGWIDMHAHHQRESMGQIPSRGFEHAIYLAYGVTSTRDPAPSSLNVWPAKELVDAGLVLGPRMFGTGETLTAGDEPLKPDTDSQEEAEGHALRFGSWGAESLKQYLQPRREKAQWIVDAGRKHGMIVTSEGGNFDLSHNIGLVMDGHAGFEHAFVQFPIHSDVARFLGQAGFYYSPTAVVGGSAPWSEEYFFQESDVWRDEKQRRWMPWRQLVPHARRRPLRPVTDYGFPIVAEGMADVIRAGGYGAIGSHGQQHGLASHWEVWIAAEALGPMGALEVASVHGARFLGLYDDLGTIETGKLADLVVVGSNPLDDIRNTLDMRFVMKGGFLYEAETLDEVWPEARQFGEYYWVDPDALKSDTLSVDHWRPGNR